MKIAILGDTHFGMRSDSLDFHRYYEKFYSNVFFPYLLENDIKIIFQLGDLFDRRKFINFNSLYMSRKYFFDVAKKHNIQIHTLLGNHDVSYKNTLEVNSSEMLLEGYDNIHVYKKHESLCFDNALIDIIPWICDDNESEILEHIKNSKAEICFGHFEISGFEMDRGTICHEGMDSKVLDKYDMVLTGHFHHKSNNGNIFYVGTPGEMTWADYNDPRGFHIFDDSTRELQFIQNPFKMFHKITYDDGATDFEYWKQYNFSELKDCYVKVVTLNKQNPYLFDNVIDSLYKVGAADISIVEDFTDIIVDDEEIIDQAEDTMTILSKFIDNLTTNVESDKLKLLMRELYIEALNSEG